MFEQQFATRMSKIADEYAKVEIPAHIGLGAAAGALGSKYLGLKNRRTGAIAGGVLGLAVAGENLAQRMYRRSKIRKEYTGDPDNISEADILAKK